MINNSVHGENSDEICCSRKQGSNYFVDLYFCLVRTSDIFFFCEFGLHLHSVELIGNPDDQYCTFEYQPKCKV